ncbi:MAG: hypothetical protein ACI8Z7_000791 [Candidatus Nanohaloarchaea archaeon]|jgi:hypothetical protein
MEGRMMDYSINPEKHELESVRRDIEEIVEKYSYSLEVETVEFTLGWQIFEKDCNVLSGEKTLNVIINPDKELENLEKHVLRGLLEIEFMEKTEYQEIRYNWQEIARMAYVKIRSSNLRDEELSVDENIEERWSDLKPKLENETEEFDEELYLNAGVLADAVANHHSKNGDLEKLPKAKKDDVIKAGDALFN